MFDFTVPQSTGFPMAWWLSWFAIASIVYVLLGIWFWRSARQHDRTAGENEGKAAD